jgi:maltose O-acetyltransferase
MRFEIGRHSYIFMNTWFDSRSGFKMGNHSVVNQRCHFETSGGIEIGENVSISAEVCILTSDHDPQSPTFSERKSPVLIEDYAFIGMRAIILRGVTIGRGSIVAAGSLVSHSVRPYTIVAGVPARAVGSRPENLEYTIDYDRLFF